MTKLRLLFSCLLMVASSHGQSAPPPAPLTVAVLPFESSDEKLKGRASEISVVLGAQLSASPNLWMVEREDLDKILSEHTIKLSGLTDPAAAVEIGRILGAKILVTGRVIRSGDGAILVAKIMSAETSRVFGETASAADPAALEKPVADLAEKIDRLVTKQRQALVPPLPGRADRIAKLKETLQGKVLPSVRISVSEQDLSRPVIDPAVETELGKIVLELGGQVFDPKSGGKADVAITGEAISQTGARRGQLVSARARVEIKAVREAEGKVLAIDRETSVAVDIAEGIAGKSALQDAAITLAERLLPKLVLP
jgi:TolB-like protein